ncbi:DUF2703 domain-containing protein [uncultured Methanospirillum sp.]|uniref:DUF2703 domain-containing protein n=1 Tax=uncultured Methanospirillum sp. TaxID=262503 RepID=UPI0029C77E10|nr:DUF2703 domain-containing protein [uncultured Methanospirillum sp.]
MTKELYVEWLHVGADVTHTCVRCSATGTTVAAVIKDVEPELTGRGIQIVYTETVLPSEQLPESNKVLINGKPLEEYLTNARVVQTCCESCACIVEQESAECRAIQTPDELYESLPADLIRRVLMIAADQMDERTGSSNGCCG